MKYLVEFIGTFFLILTIVVTVAGTAGAMAPVAIGLVLMVMVYAGGHISGAHYNPAVTLGVFIRGKCSAADVPMYIIAQCLGAVAAAFAGKFLLSGMGDPAGIAATAPASFSASGNLVQALLAEFLGTFALVWVVLNTATANSNAGNSFYGLAIGMTVTACAYGLGSVSGGAFNPAVALGVSTAGMTNWANIGIFLVGQFAAAALAAIIFKMAYAGDEDE